LRRIDRHRLPIRREPLTKRGVTIERDVRIGAGVCILDGVTIRAGWVIAAGAVVIPSVELEPKVIYGGVLARKIAVRRTEPAREE
jgi:acetyltransferase-like isoleucine patch superfamily enzyme